MMTEERVMLARAGRQTLEVIEPDVVIYTFHGITEVEELCSLRAAQTQWEAGKQYVLVLIDNRSSHGATPAARKAALRSSGGTESRALAVLANPGYARGVMDLALRAIQKLSRRAMQFRLFADEKEAFAWLGEMREEYRRRFGLTS